MAPQTIANRYIKLEDLRSLLTKKFGAGNFTIQTPAQEVVYLTNSILRGARKCFAILVLISRTAAISNFFQRDSLQRSCPDDGLPYTSETLQRIFEKDTTSLTVKRFLEKQWMFVIPVFRRHMISRKLDKEIILPFLSEEPAGRGSMGTVWKMKLHPDCHRLPLDGDIVIRKQIECGRDGDMTVFKKELENLSLLTHLNHPNIVQLYCSYMYRDRYNLMFAVANGGSLADLLNGKEGTKGPDGSQLWLALADLASAIDALHNFTSELLDLSLSGCHHDLAPRNILIHGKTFVLADFGLSSFRSASFRSADEDSLTTFKDVRGFYVAPECQTLDDKKVKSQKVNRASDIWSFGCILSEVLTHSVLGPNGVEQFRSKRKVQVASGMEWFRFHCGPERSNPGVECWLENLQADAGPVSARWYFAFHRLLDELHQSKLDKLELDFSKTIQALEELHYISEGSIGAGQPRRRTFLQYHHARLLEALPPHYRSFAKERMVELVLESNDATQLRGLSEAVTDAGDEDIGTLVAVKRLTIMSNDGSLIENMDLILDKNDVNLSVDIDNHSAAVLETTSEHVLVEWLRYGDVWVDEVIGMSCLLFEL
ncbi:protein kinase domain-containing protein [Beauveria bassiana ARSEF 2860]|uniref:Protein kinase domain-containing protein n=1 Tax=Beauveria bassiana (strain ARSEF 2860) TaxID=655819 RepID=J5J984_BEAB2|nr:protein kinase domain-containing protein [Beauveria bassiana ARSEF 2860]EJP60701.1 protein kinase domain-containing protein [Beauveria bassiana ARSEF 2860]